MNAKEWNALIDRVKQYFDIRELVTRARWKARGEKAWRDFRPEALLMLVYVRERWGLPLKVNDWSLGGTMENCGLRDEPIGGATFSGHLLGCCFDLHCNDELSLYEMCLANYVQLGITEMETKSLTITVKGQWVHVSVRPTGIDSLQIIS